MNKCLLLLILVGVQVQSAEAFLVSKHYHKGDMYLSRLLKEKTYKTGIEELDPTIRPLAVI